MKANTHCPNCGAIVKGITCEYCGTQFIDIADLKMGEKAYLRLNYNGAIYTFKVIPFDATITCDTSPIYMQSMALIERLHQVYQQWTAS